MPARVVDGDGLWRSKKLKRMSPEFRGEYANLVPLAEANGVFDCDPDRVWSDVYAFNRPEIYVETVEKILYELEQVDLLRRWKDKDKVWGYWTGIHKSGRLPTGVHLKRYKNLPPEPPPEITFDGDRPEPSGIDPGLSHDDPPWFGIGLDRNGIGMVRETEPAQDNFLEDGQEEDMKAEKAIPVSCMEILGERAETYSDVIEQIKSRARATSNGQVLREFEEWAVENQGDDFRGKPLSAWLRSYTSGRIEQKQATENPMVKTIGREIAYRSCNQMVLEPKHKAALVPIIEEDSYTFEEVLGAYSEFFQKMDKDNPKNIQYAANNFVAQAADLLYSVRRKATEKQAEQAAVAATAERMQLEAEQDRQKRLEAREREQELVEEELPD